MISQDRIGVVAIGRNEGERLRTCLRSLVGRAGAVVYVDSGSTDGSVALARSLGAEVVELDLALPFTAARARNAGFERLRQVLPAVEFVQFVDGDCEVRSGWLADAIAAFEGQPRWAVVCGRRRERRPEASVFNRLCDIEWDTPVGEASACGGDALMRVVAFVEVGGFDDSLIAGEEPEMCVRMRRHGWTIHRLAAEMTWHDAAMTRLGQWWKRTVRAGHGRVYRHCRRRGLSQADAARYAAFTTLGKFPGLVGQLQYWGNRLLRRRTRLIEYKGAAA
ncbi:MAG: glycosyltransferase [Planctomycetia bacterium]|nr:glycosyltransferase [Planctomycetia bacterium]